MTTEFDMPVYGIMGNHDHEYMNSQDLESPYIDRILNYTADLWEGKLIYEEQALDSFKKWGYYQQRLKNHEKARFIGINTNACYIYNEFISKTKNDPG